MFGSFGVEKLIGVGIGRFNIRIVGFANVLWAIKHSSCGCYSASPSII